MSCKKCKQNFSCSCQQATASDGATVHKSCLEEYEQTIKKK
jgi:hypothetical protein